MAVKTERSRREDIFRNLCLYIEDFTPSYKDYSTMVLEEMRNAWDNQASQDGLRITMPTAPPIKVEDKRTKNWDLPFDVVKEDALEVIGLRTFPKAADFKNEMKKIGYPEPEDFRESVIKLLSRLETKSLAFFDKDGEGRFINIRTIK